MAVGKHKVEVVSVALAACVAVIVGCAPAQTAPIATVTVTSPASQQVDASSTRPTPSTTIATPSTPPVSGPKSVIETDGTFLVGTDIAPGLYRTPGSSDCYWARLDSLDTSDIIDNNLSAGQQVVEILPTDRAFLTEGCSTWSLASAPTAALLSPTDTAPQNSAAVPPDLSCDYRLAFALQTSLSAVAICDDGSGQFTYKGLRLKDGARIDVQGAVPTGTGFTAVNDGTRYEVSRSGLTIYTNDGEVYSEPAISSGP